MGHLKRPTVIFPPYPNNYLQALPYILTCNEMLECSYYRTMYPS